MKIEDKMAIIQLIIESAEDSSTLTQMIQIGLEEEESTSSIEKPRPKPRKLKLKRVGIKKVPVRVHGRDFPSLSKCIRYFTGSKSPKMYSKIYNRYIKGESLEDLLPNIANER